MSIILVHSCSDATSRELRRIPHVCELPGKGREGGRAGREVRKREGGEEEAGGGESGRRERGEETNRKRERSQDTRVERGWRVPALGRALPRSRSRSCTYLFL